ncbi:MAG: DegQ family serine endoprotease [Cycloclasticus sp.]|nr:DegQ family serine endoprotease [Cycloclasticus sp.]
MKIGRLIGVLLLFSLSRVEATNLPDFTALVEKNSQSVVNISTTQTVKSQQPMFSPEFNLPDGSQYGDLLKHFFGQPRQPSKKRETHSLGSGFIISTDGYVLTNHHVVKGADEIIVRLQDRRELKATLIGSDERSDVALLKIAADKLPVAKLGVSQHLKVGEWVFAIGSPFGFESSVTAGIVSATGRSLPNENYVPFIQTDVAINPGNSGGPLFNLNGEVVGINSQIYSRSGGFMGLSFAIPIDMAMTVSQQLKASGRVVRGWLGVRIQDVTRELAESFKMEKPRGALIAQIINGSPAALAGLKVGDVIIAFNGKNVDISSSLPPMVGITSLDKEVPVTIIRDQAIKVINVSLQKLPEEPALLSKEAGVKPRAELVLGMSVKNINKSVQNPSSVPLKGVVVVNVSAEPALHSGIRPGDVLVQLDGHSLESVHKLKQVVAKLPDKGFISVLINRQGAPIFLALKK